MKKLSIAIEPTTRGDLMCIACGWMYPHCDFEIVTLGAKDAQAGIHKKCFDSVRAKRGAPAKKRAVFTVPAEKVTAKTLRAVDYITQGDPIPDEYLAAGQAPCEPPEPGATDSVEPSLGGAGNTSSRD